MINHESTKGQPRKHKVPKCSATKAHIQKNPISDPAKCSVTKAHIDIYHRDNVTVYAQARDTKLTQNKITASKLKLGERS